ncbi:MAG: C25 family cysteine peptidase, partial [Bacteroidota bacterium]
GEADYVHMDFVRDTLLNYTYTEVTQRYDGNVPGIPNTNATIMSADFNEGIGVVNFCNHGSTTGWSVANYSNSHVNQLTNVNMLPFIWSVACVNGNFVSNYCFAEAWLRATHEDQPTGAIGTMMSTINQAWQPPMTGQDEMVTLLAEMSTFDNINTYQRTFGGLSINGSMAMIPAHGSSGTEMHHTWVLFGDPTLKVRTAAPTAFELTYNPVILIGTESLEVNAPDADGATVALSYYDTVEEEVVIVGTAVVEDGVATVNFDIPLVEPGTLTLTVMGFNKQTYINEEIQVIPPDGPYVIFDQLTIDDNAGNDNNQADYGETITLNVSLKNVGIEKAEEVSAILSTDSEHVTIVNNEAFWGEIDEAGNLMVNAAFTIEVNHVIPDNTNILFNLVISGQDVEEEDKVWNSGFALKIFSPMFTISEFVLDDTSENDLLEPGESGDLVVTYTNTGGAPAMAPVAHLIASSPYLTIDNDMVEPETIAPGDSIEIAYTVHAHASALEGTFVDLIFTIEDNHFFESAQTLVIGQIPEAQIGDGNSSSNQYPFYNYYKANRSQMIYTADELGAGEKTILEIGFDIIQIATQYNNLPNFVIRMMHTDQDAFSGSFVNTSEAEVVFQASSYQMPTATGWQIWEIEPFDYNGESNLLVEIVWGLLPQWTSDYYKVASTSAGANRVAFGYSDSQAVPAYNGTSQVRPNLFLTFEAEETHPSQLVEFVVKNQLDEMLEAEIKIGSFKMNTSEEGHAQLELQPGTYHANVDADSHAGLENEEFIIEAPEDGGDGEKEEEPVPDAIIEFMLTRLFNTTFAITDMYGNEVTDAVIAMDDNTYEEGHYQFDYMMPGEYTYTITRSTYFDYEGSFELTDDHANIEVVMMPDGTAAETLDQNGFSVYPNPFSNQLKIQMAEGTTGEVQIIDILGNVVLTRSQASGAQYFNLGDLPTGNYFVRIITIETIEVFKVSRIK